MLSIASARSACARWARPRLELACALLAACSAAAWLASLHWVAELFSHFTAHYLVVALALAALLWTLRSRVWAAAACALAAAHLGSVLSSGDVRAAPRPVAEGEETIVLVQHNVHLDHPDPAHVAAWLRTQAADVVVLVEVGPQWLPVLAELRDVYPHQAVQAQAGPFGVAMLARSEPEAIAVHRDDDERPPYGEVDLRMPASGRSVRVLGVHPPPPITAALARARDAQLGRLAARAAADDGRVTVVAGDFNATPWSPLYRSLRGLGLKDAGLRVVAHGTWPAAPGSRVWGIAIDHAMIAGAARIVAREVGPDLGSDHRAVRTVIAFGG